MLREPRLEPRQPRGDRLLRGVALDLAFADEGGITFETVEGIGGSRWEMRARRGARYAGPAPRVNARMTHAECNGESGFSRSPKFDSSSAPIHDSSFTKTAFALRVNG